MYLKFINLIKIIGFKKTTYFYKNLNMSKMAKDYTRITTNSLSEMKQRGEKIAMLTS